MTPLRSAALIAAASLGAGLAVGCSSSGDDPKKYAEQEAKRSEPKRPERNIVTFQPAVPGGKHVACDDLLAGGAMRSALDQPVALIDRWSDASAPNAVCIVVEAARAAEHRQASVRADDAIGKTIGLEDALCRVEATCYHPLDEATVERRCYREKPDGAVIELAGSVGCLRQQSTKDPHSKLMEAGRVEHVKYEIRAFEPDTKCGLTVYALDDVHRARACATAAIEAIDRDSIASFE